MNVLLTLFKKDLLQAIRDRYILGLLILPIVVSLGAKIYLQNPEQRFSVSTNASPDSHLAMILKEIEFADVIYDMPPDTLESEVMEDVRLGIRLEDEFDVKLDSIERPSIQFIVNSNHRFGEQILQSIMSSILLAFESERQVFAEVKDINDHSEQPFNLKNEMMVIILISCFSFVAIMAIPLLMIKEREQQTLQFLRVSPAFIYDVIMSKALVSILCCIIIEIGVLVILEEISLLTSPVYLGVSVLTILFVTGTGLFATGILKTTIQFNSWSWLPMFFLLSFVFSDALPQSMTLLSQALHLLPTYIASGLMQDVLQNTVLWERVGLDLGYLALWTLVIYVLTFWIYQGENAIS